MAEEGSTEHAGEKHYDFKAIEPRWQEYWEKEAIYRFDHDSEKPPYTIDNPPRYASGALHLGHAVHYTHIDFVARYKRMRGYNVMFPLCFDVNGMPIEVNVEKKYGIRMRETPRQDFIKLCRDFANANISEMTRQFRILGESMDPSEYYQTDAEYYRRVTQVSFIKLFKKGLIYKGEFPVNWCPRCSTALAESEVEYEERTTKLNYIKFRIKESREDLIIATTRPELLCTCQLVALHPDDPRAQELRGKTALTPIYNREVPIVVDERVDPEFGTGIVMICTIGDKDDLRWVYEYGLSLEKGIDEDGRMTSLAGPYEGKSITEARAAIIEDLRAKDLLLRQEDLEQNVGTCWRCHTPIEFLQVPQWFLKTKEFKDEIIKMASKVKWYPEFMKKRLVDWTQSLEWDWVISRQRYFATPIPLWECENCGEVVVAREEDCYVDPTIDPPPVDGCPKCGGPLKGCEDVFDTWMDSSISALYIAYWQRDEERFKKLFPTSFRPQSHDIIRTWAFYTILRSYLLEQDIPWKEIMIGGFILAEDGSPMHASRGNAVDPLQFLEEYGADALRYFAAQCPIGEDNAFRWRDVQHGNRFLQKFWNVSKLIGKEVGTMGSRPETPANLRAVDRWILAEYYKCVKTTVEHMDSFRFDLAIKSVEGFMWHTLADHYLEMIKHRIGTGDKALQYTLYTIGLGVTKLLAPFLPHITEEVYHRYYKHLLGNKSIHLIEWDEPLEGKGGLDIEALNKGAWIRDTIAAIRSWKASKGIRLGASIAYAAVISPSSSVRNAILEGEEDIKSTMRIEKLEVGERADLEYFVREIRPIPGRIGPVFKKDTNVVISGLKALNNDPEGMESMAADIERNGRYVLEVESGNRYEIEADMVEVLKGVRLKGHRVESINVGAEIIIMLEA